jgi:hypothetical protein
VSKSFFPREVLPISFLACSQQIAWEKTAFFPISIVDIYMIEFEKTLIVRLRKGPTTPSGCAIIATFQPFGEEKFFLRFLGPVNEKPHPKSAASILAKIDELPIKK